MKNFKENNSFKYGDAKFDFYRNNFMLKELIFIGKEKG